MRRWQRLSILVRALVATGGVLALAAALFVTSAIVDADGGGPRAEGQTVVFALGDAAGGQPAAAKLAAYVTRQRPDRFFYLGDVYEQGTPAEFRKYYQPLFGRLADRTDPVIGNHEYPNRERGYYAYWQAKRSWSREKAKHRAYVDRASGWQVIAYSSETDMAEEAAWVARQIAKRNGTCRIALAHKGRHPVADEDHEDNEEQEPVWRQLTGTTAINLVAHSHVYGRVAPIEGVHVIVSGLGGHEMGLVGEQHHAVRGATSGVATATRLVLRRGAAEIRQVDANGKVYASETIRCTPARARP